MEKTVHLLIMYTMLVLTLLLFHKGRKNPLSLMLAVYALVEVITNGLNSLTLSAGASFFDRFPFAHFIYKPLYCLWVPLFYLYFRYCFSSGFQLRKKHYLHFIPFTAFLLLFLLIWIVKGNHYIWENLYLEGSFLKNAAFLIDVTVKVQYLFYNFIMIYSLVRIERARRLHPSTLPGFAVNFGWLRFIVYGYSTGCLIAIAVFLVKIFNNPAWSVINMVSVAYFFLFFFAIFYNTISHKPFNEELKPREKATPGPDLQQLMKRIDGVVLSEQLFLEPELSLQQIATALHEKERIISQAINTVKQRNVNDYINVHRIKYACRLLLEEPEKPVFEVMYESGFSTKGAFNLAFKKITGKTPTQYREENRSITPS